MWCIVLLWLIWLWKRYWRELRKYNEIQFEQNKEKYAREYIEKYGLKNIKDSKCRI
jgi:uncharacterized protein YlbG (UPF0298 family)